MDFQRTPRGPRVPPRYPNRIREYRVKIGRSQQWLAQDVGRSVSMVSRWERGKTLPTVPNLFRLAKALSTFAEALYPTFYVPRHEKPTLA